MGGPYHQEPDVRVVWQVSARPLQKNAVEWDKDFAKKLTDQIAMKS